MGTHKNIGYDFFPKQRFVGKEVEVYFHYEPSFKIPGIIVRDDSEKPHITIIKLKDGRYVLNTECFVCEPEKPQEKIIVYQTKEIQLDQDTKHIVIGSIAARSYLDMDNYPHYVVREGEVITEDIVDRMLSQGREAIEIKTAIGEKDLIDF